jgi:peroxiredoxin Q/BCP
MVPSMSLFHKILSTITGNPSTSEASEAMAIGSPVPAISQLNQDETSISLRDVGACGYLLVYFYPKADTPGCTKQACSLRDAFASLVDHGVHVLGVSTDTPRSQKDFQQKYQLPFDLLADHDATVVKAFGIPTTMGYAKRQAFLFHKGTLIWRDLSASTTEQAADILKVITSGTTS